jgi:hypothetical protein
MFKFVLSVALLAGALTILSVPGPAAGRGAERQSNGRALQIERADKPKTPLEAVRRKATGRDRF